MRAVVIGVNQRSNRLALKDDSGGYVLVDVLDGTEVRCGLVLRGPLHSLGRAVLIDVDSGTALEVCIENFDCSLHYIRAMLAQ